MAADTPTETLVAELHHVSGFLAAYGAKKYSETVVQALDFLTTQSALIETLTRERDGILAERNNLMASLAYTEAALAVYDTIKAYGTPEELADMMAYVSGEATGEVAKLKASLAHCAMSLGREIALAADARNKALEEVEARLNKMAAEKKVDWDGEIGAEAATSQCILNTIEVCATFVRALKSEAPHAVDSALKSA